MAIMTNDSISGYLVINKPVGITSFDCIRRIKRLLPHKTKIGHAGTLDPFASGLLIVAIGRSATKTLSTLTNADKEYVVKAKLGELTDTLDHSGNVIASEEPTASEADLRQAMKSLYPSYTQVPPIYSALKYQGRPLHKLAREKKIPEEELESIVQAKARTVTFTALDLNSYQPPFFTITATVSKGAYLRSLVNDIAQKCGTVATAYELTRTRVGHFDLAKAVDLDDLKTWDDIKHRLVKMVTS